MNVGVVILNYNAWQHTLACVESVLASTEPPAWVIIVDNASANDSIRWIRHWAAGNMEFVLPELGVSKSCCKPVPLFEVANDEVPNIPMGNVILVRNSENKGYAAGNNAGIRLLMQYGADAVWILNNDTIVENTALAELKKSLFAKQRPGLCGARIQYLGTDTVQCRGGGKTNPWTGLSRLDGCGLSAHKALQDSAQAVEGRINFIYGASVMASRDFIETVGLLDERYFLYCEEQDWAYSAKGAFDLSYAPNALVHHKEGGTTNFSYRKVNIKALWWLTRSRLLLTAKHKPWALPTVCLSIAFAAFRMLWRRLVIRPFTF